MKLTLDNGVEVTVPPKMHKDILNQVIYGESSAKSTRGPGTKSFWDDEKRALLLKRYDELTKIDEDATMQSKLKQLSPEFGASHAALYLHLKKEQKNAKAPLKIKNV